MSGSIQNKLLQFEVAPPPDVWDKLSRRLDEEFVVADSHISSTLESASVVPPADIWDRINAELNDNVPVGATPRKIIPLFVRIAVAAAIIGILILGGLYFLNSNKTETIVKTVPGQPSTPAAVMEKKQPKIPDTGTSTVITNSETVVPALKKEEARPVPKPRVETITEDAYSSSDFIPRPEEAPLYDLQTVSALQPVSVTAPPLRDKTGNIIMDASLISNPDDEFITVTGPNGKQTKISCKFLSCLSYINVGINSNDADSRAIQCKTQFEEWRKKIIAQPAFIPTANNFFDIFELKDLIQEM